jgi:hypothetical protein
MSGYAYLVREMDKYGLRVFCSYAPLTLEQKVKGNASPRKWNQVYLEYPNFLFTIQAYHEGATPCWTNDWEDTAAQRNLINPIKEMGNWFAAGIFGLAHKPYFEWLECNVCGAVKMCPRSAGAPSANRKCDISFGCKGKMRRLPQIYELVLRVSAAKGPKSRTKKVPGAPETRGRRGYGEEVALEAVRLHNLGMSYTDVAKALQASMPGAEKISVSTVSLLVRGKEATQ